MRVFLPPSDDHHKVAASKKSHSLAPSSEEAQQLLEQHHRHPPPPFKKKKVDQNNNFSSSSSTGALLFSSGGTAMCPPSLKRGDSDGDENDNNNNNNLSLRGGEEQRLQVHHRGIDSSANNSTSNNIIAASSTVVKMGMGYDEFNNEILLKSSNSDVNQNYDDDGDAGLKISHTAAAAATTDTSNISKTETSSHPDHKFRTIASTTENPAEDDDSECRGGDSEDELVKKESLSRTIFLGDGNTKHLDHNDNRHSRRRSCRNQASLRSLTSSPWSSEAIMRSSSNAATVPAPAPLLNRPIPGSKNDLATMSKADEYYGLKSESTAGIYKRNNNKDDDSLSTFSRFINLLRTQHKPALDVVPMEGDGNCLFRAISLQVYGDVTMHMDVRRDCLDYMERDADHFRDFVTYSGHEEFNEYVARKRKNGVHGNHAEIQAMSELYNRSIEVYVPDHGIEPINIFHSEYKGVGDAPIRLCYMDGNHYDAVVDPLLPTAGLGLCLPGLQPGLADRLQLEEAKKKSSESALEEKMRLALEESQRTIKEREELELREALQKSCEFATTVDSNDDLYKKKAMYLSEIESAEFDLEQAVLASSLESFQTAEQERKPPSFRRNDGRRNRFNSSPRSMRASSTSPVYQANIATNANEAMSPSYNQYAASAAAFASLPNSSVPAGARSYNDDSITTDEYPACVQELVMNGFELSKVVHAYELVGDNFDDLLSFLLSSIN